MRTVSAVRGLVSSTERPGTGGGKNAAGFWDRDAAGGTGCLLRRALGSVRVLKWLQVG